jgi:predicted regulator of Ras-like GTPase activity (Roadblock/LC7/MglB family)
MGADGIAVEEYRAEGVEPLDVASIAAECQHLLEQARKTLGSLEGEIGGELQELVLRTAGHQIAFHPVDEEYFVAIALSGEGFLGKARYLVAGLLQEIRQGL